MSTQPIVESAFSLWKSDTAQKLSGKIQNRPKQGVWEKKYKNSSKNEPGFLLESEGSGADPVKDMGVHMYTQ